MQHPVAWPGFPDQKIKVLYFFLFGIWSFGQGSQTKKSKFNTDSFLFGIKNVQQIQLVLEENHLPEIPEKGTDIYLCS